MLEAFLRKNVRRVLCSREHKNDRDEDAITSMVFTPLRFMPPEHAFKCFAAIFPDLNKRVSPLSVSCVASEIDLWPKKLRAANANRKKTRVEPDLMARFRFSDGTDQFIQLRIAWGQNRSALVDH